MKIDFTLQLSKITSMIVGICGKKFSGKDTAAKALINMGFIPLAFATPLKDALGCIFTFTDEQLNGKEKETIDPYWKVTPREMLQFIGTDLFRDILSTRFPNTPMGNHQIWVSAMDHNIRSIKSNIVITDVRFQNEVDLIHSHGGIVIEIQRPSTIIDSHASENNILTSDFQIKNDSTIQQLHENIINIVSKMI